jgi:hypothetical protein
MRLTRAFDIARLEEISMVITAALWISERNRATSSRATSNRRRSLRSRRLKRTAPGANQLTGAPINSIRLHPAVVFSRTSRVVPTVFQPASEAKR